MMTNQQKLKQMVHIIYFGKNKSLAIYIEALTISLQILEQQINYFKSY